ncbi:glycerophosphodiester phosphodiesterase [Parafrigoribacterium mesophilum]|uniref:glycerophosphodiester phosphodiesterase family protein n=1 Tax=Parafrigoribacterium mesophilum TaxID=433646 RepID=UPI0031FD7C69
MRRQSGFFAADSCFPGGARILAHRGFAVDAPENTLLAFERALALGVDYLETDVRASADAEAILSHDPDLFRLTGRNVPVRQLSAAQLRGTGLGQGQGYASLADALHAFPQARFNIDVKSPDAIAGTVRAVREAGAHDRVLITSFSDARRLAVLAQLPGVATSASARTFAVAIAAASAGAGPVLRRVLHNIDAVQIPESRNGVRFVTSRTIRLFHAADVEVHVWTVNAQADMRRLLDLGVDGLVTDRADLAVQLMTGK